MRNSVGQSFRFPMQLVGNFFRVEIKFIYQSVLLYQFNKCYINLTSSWGIFLWPVTAPHNNIVIVLSAVFYQMNFVSDGSREK